jgi:hypothetical protein
MNGSDKMRSLVKPKVRPSVRDVLAVMVTRSCVWKRHTRTDILTASKPLRC